MRIVIDTHRRVLFGNGIDVKNPVEPGARRRLVGGESLIDGVVTQDRYRTGTDASSSSQRRDRPRSRSGPDRRVEYRCLRPPSG
jgi:hypothetical protein